jgi:hypothetical protein
MSTRRKGALLEQYLPFYSIINIMTEKILTLPKARQIAQMRLERMAQVLHWLEEESYGIL